VFTSYTIYMKTDVAPLGWPTNTDACAATGSPITVYVNGAGYTDLFDAVVTSGEPLYLNSALNPGDLYDGDDLWYKDQMSAGGNVFQIGNAGEVATWTACAPAPTPTPTPTPSPTPAPVYIEATGGTVTTYAEGGKFYKAHTFASSDNFVVTQLGNDTDRNKLEYLVVAGGGGGGGRPFHGGGGGAGGYIINSVQATLTSYPLVIGAGGPGYSTDSSCANSGQDTTGFSQTAVGGGGGGGPLPYSDGPGCNGGSGGGSSVRATTVATGTSGQGNNGGPGATPDDPAYGAGGGGGAGAAGGGGTNTFGGVGGAGLSNTLRTGSAVYYAGGGGGSVYESTASGAGGIGGGGAGAYGVGGENGTANTGGGGGGRDNRGSENKGSGNGGSGIVIVRYEIESL
jgi:hypothetical protein